MLLAVLVLALVVPARLHALVAAEAPVYGHAAPQDHASMHHHAGTHHSDPAPEPARPADPQNTHAQCLTACLVIPVPAAGLSAPMLRLRAIVAVPVTAWLDSLSPPRLDRPPRPFS